MTKAQRFFAAIKRSNRAFARMTKPQKRVRVAKDVIAALTAKAIKPGWGYMNGDGVGDDVWRSTPEVAAKQLQDVLPTIPACEVCAKGALFVCTVMRRDQVKVSDGMHCNGDELSEQLGGIFSGNALDEIENYFENGGWALSNAAAERQRKARMILVMKNIIRNKGTFKSDQERP